MNANNLTDTLKDRVIFFLKKSEVSFSEFSRIANVSTAYIPSLKQNIGIDKLKILKNINKNLSLDWLLLGIGEMFSDNETLRKLEKENADLRRENALLQKLTAAYETQLNGTKTGHKN